MDIVKKESPINDELNKKKAGYYVSDQLTLFYFKYIYRNLSRLAVMNPESFYDKFIAPDFEEHYVPKAFEQIKINYYKNLPRFLPYLLLLKKRKRKFRGF